MTAEVLIIRDLYTLLPRISRKQNALSIDCQAVKCHRKMEEAGRLPPDSVVPAGPCAVYVGLYQPDARSEALTGMKSARFENV